jgi:hypothetical protein
MLKRLILTTILLYSFKDFYAQSRLDSLTGSWQIVNYQRPTKDTTIYQAGNGCRDFLVLNIDSKNKIKFVFTDKKDSIVFSGRVKLNRDKTIKVDNNIHEILYLKELEECVTAPLRIDLRMTFYRTFNFTIQNDILTFYYDLPAEPTVIKTMTFVRRKD